MKRLRRKLWSIVIVVVMVVAMLPMMVYAEGDSDATANDPKPSMEVVTLDLAECFQRAEAWISSENAETESKEEKLDLYDLTADFKNQKLILTLKPGKQFLLTGKFTAKENSPYQYQIRNKGEVVADSKVEFSQKFEDKRVEGIFTNAEEGVVDGGTFVGFSYDIASKGTRKGGAFDNLRKLTVKGVGEEVQNKTVYVGENISLDAGTKEGYAFEKWELEGLADGTVSDEKLSQSKLEFKMPAADVTATAVWKEIPEQPEPEYFKVTYWADDEQVGEEQIVASGSKATPPEVPSKTGYTGVWKQDGLNITADTKIEAEYTPITYVLSFDTDGGSDIASIEIAYQEEIEKPENPTKEGYEFVSWDPEIPERMPASNLTVKAIWHQKAIDPKPEEPKPEDPKPVDPKPTDTTPPVIKGIEDGKTYWGAKTFNVEDTDEVTVTIDGKTAVADNGSYTIPADDQKHTVIATDATGNRVTCSVTTLIVGNYKISKGENQEVTQGSPAEFTSDAEFRRFVEVRIDGKTIAQKLYSVVSGSTKVTLTAECTKGLSLGKHTVTIVSNNGEASAAFTVKAAPLSASKVTNTTQKKGSNPSTGDTSNPAFWVILMILALGGSFVIGWIYRKRNQGVNGR